MMTSRFEVYLVLCLVVIPVTRTQGSISSCIFDTDFCSWKNLSGDDFDWILNTGKTPSYRTGPAGDHTSGLGSYLYIEASSPRIPGEYAILESELFTDQGKCFHFFYNMYGSGLGTLRISVVSFDVTSDPMKVVGTTTVWELLSNQGPGWKQGVVKVTPVNNYPFKVQIVGEIGLNYQGDIAIDDVTFTVSDGCVQTPAESTPTHTHPITISSCIFDTDFCSWKNLSGDDFDWILNTGKTPSSGTGPAGDHTSGSGSYLYIEASSPRTSGDYAFLESELFTDQGKCFHFFYNMYGSGVGTLGISVVSFDVTSDPMKVVGTTTVWELSSNQGPGWKQGVVKVTPVNNYPFKVQIVGERGLNYQGDIAIDDVTFTVSDGCVQTPAESTNSSIPTTHPYTAGSTPSTVPTTTNTITPTHTHPITRQ